MLDDVATDLASWIDDTATQIAVALGPAGVSPFSATLTEQQKLEYYRTQLFNPDGTPNLQGRQAQINRLGPEGFAQVYKAVIKAYPDLRVPAPPGGEAPPTQAGAPAPVIPPPTLPRGVTGPTIAQVRAGA
jgi:hypothetical protein